MEPSISQPLLQSDNYCKVQKYLKSTPSQWSELQKERIQNSNAQKLLQRLLTATFKEKSIKAHSYRSFGALKNTCSKKKNLFYSGIQEKRKRGRKLLHSHKSKEKILCDSKTFLLNKSFTPKKIEVPESFKLKQRVSNKSKLIFGDFF